MGDKLTSLKTWRSVGVVLNGFHAALKRFSLKGGACEEAGAFIVDDSISASCIIQKEICGGQTCEQTAHACKPVNSACK